MQTQVRKVIEQICHNVSSVISYLLNTIFVPLLQRQDLISALLRVVDFLPCFLLLLLEEGDAVREQLRVPLNATTAAVKGVR